jgi:hypothetical protein
MAAGHVGGSPGLIDEDQTLGIEIELIVEPALALPQDVGTALLDRVPDLFLRVIP